METRVTAAHIDRLAGHFGVAVLMAILLGLCS
jgi:hypothetical protein